MNKYEVMFIVKVSDEEAIKSAGKLVQDTIVKNGGTVEKVDEWGRRQLAYEVTDRRLLLRNRLYDETGKHQGT